MSVLGLPQVQLTRVGGCGDRCVAAPVIVPLVVFLDHYCSSFVPLGGATVKKQKAAADLLRMSRSKSPLLV